MSSASLLEEGSTLGALPDECRCSQCNVQNSLLYCIVLYVMNIPVPIWCRRGQICVHNAVLADTTVLSNAAPQSNIDR